MSDMTTATLVRHYAEVRKRLIGTPVKVVPEPTPKPEPEPEPAPKPELTIEPYLPPLSVAVFIVPKRKKEPSVDLICREVCKFYQIARREFFSDRRTDRIAKSRHVAFYLCKKMTKLSLPAIGRFTGGRDHTTVLHGLRKIEKNLPYDNQLDLDVATISSRILEKQKDLGIIA